MDSLEDNKTYGLRLPEIGIWDMLLSHYASMLTEFEAFAKNIQNYNTDDLDIGSVIHDVNNAKYSVNLMLAPDSSLYETYNSLKKTYWLLTKSTYGVNNMESLFLKHEENTNQYDQSIKALAGYLTTKDYNEWTYMEKFGALEYLQTYPDSYTSKELTAKLDMDTFKKENRIIEGLNGQKIFVTKTNSEDIAGVESQFRINSNYSDPNHKATEFYNCYSLVYGKEYEINIATQSNIGMNYIINRIDKCYEEFDTIPPEIFDKVRDTRMVIVDSFSVAIAEEEGKAAAYFCYNENGPYIVHRINMSTQQHSYQHSFVHEFGHAYDYAIGGGKYLSDDYSDRLKKVVWKNPGILRSPKGYFKDDAYTNVANNPNYSPPAFKTKEAGEIAYDISGEELAAMMQRNYDASNSEGYIAYDEEQILVHEVFAEMFRLYIDSPELMQEYYPDMYYVMDNFVKNNN